MSYEQLKYYKIKLRYCLVVIILLSALMVAGIPMIIIGANGDKLWIMVPGIVFTGGGFYTVPICWSAWGAAVGRKNLLHLILDEELTKVDEIAVATGKQPAAIKNKITWLIDRRYLRGYKLNPAGTELIRLVKPEKKSALRCPACNAPVSGKQAACDYCNAYLK